MTEAEIRALPYRPCVGVVLMNRAGLVFAGQRIDSPGEAWQMPQGGLDEGEDPQSGALRELEEETGIAPSLVERIADHPQQLRYDIPQAIAAKLWGGKWRGQRQDWYLCRFLGVTSDVDIATKHPEFNEWKWVEPAALPDLIVPFKRELYRRLLAEFADYL